MTDNDSKDLIARLRSAGDHMLSLGLKDVPITHKAADRIEALEAEVARLREALEDIAANIMPKDLDEDYYEAADFEDDYTRCIHDARAALEGQK